MVRSIHLSLAGFLVVLNPLLFAQAPGVENVRFEQRSDGSLLVDIYYDISSGGGLKLDISVEASGDHGETWSIPCSSLSGDIGEEIVPGEGKHIVWDFFTDNPGIVGDAFRIRVTAVQNVLGQTITDDFYLMEDLQMLPGSGHAIHIGASGITLDLGGHSITADLSEGHQEGILMDHVDSVAIKNGTLREFGGGVIIGECGNISVENMFIQNLDIDDPDRFITGIVPQWSHDILIRNCRFHFFPVPHKESIIMGSTYDFVVDSIDVLGGSVGVNFGGEGVPSNGTVTNSTFVDACMMSMLVKHSTDAFISNNTFLGCNVAVFTDPSYSGEVKGLSVRDNDISGGTSGVVFDGGIESIIEYNNIHDCSEKGIAMQYNMDCPVEDPNDNCFIATGNLIRSNVLASNELDLYHHEACLGNTWVDNSCESCDGIEIPDCSPGMERRAKAKTYLSQIDSIATDFLPDASLVKVFSGSCDTLGVSKVWTYIYESESQDTMIECRFNHGNLSREDSIKYPWMIGADEQAIPGPWIDSDSAVAIADKLGGMEFRKQFDLQSIEMAIAGQGLWNLHYVAPDTIFSVFFDASLE